MKEHIMATTHITQIDISIRELKARPAQAIAKAQSGMRVNITSHKKTVANLVAPIVLPEDALEPRIKTAAERKMTPQEALVLMRAAGLTVRESSGNIKIGPAIKFPPMDDGRTMVDLISEIRGPR
jgi:antitoxin (DNA-binding transcriptional repressor) of toxin-antitoxin stability system